MMSLVISFLFAFVVLSSGSSSLDGSPQQRPFDHPGSVRPVVKPPPLEIKPLIISGPSVNRVDLVFFSDGYLSKDKEKFIEDASRLAHDITDNQTYSSVKPLLNFWAAFSPSKERGIGVGGKPKKTPFGLYRNGTELRSVHYAHAEVAEAACALMGKRNQCDYPILLGNDPLYGGAGGKFTTITASLANGPLILRHELGHSIIKVGDEYDGGSGYRGVNAFHKLGDPVPWAHWLTSPSRGVERSVMPMQVYAWTLLNTTKAWSHNFTSSGIYARHVVRFSVSGVPRQRDLKVEMDGKDLGWVPRKDIGMDRWHYDFYRKGGLKEGVHEIKFTLSNPKLEGVAQMCSAEIMEFGNDDEFVSSPGFYGLFPTYSEKNETSYRPTNEDCLMRLVTTPNFCKVCLEGLWLSLLRQVRLIDSLKEGCNPETKAKTLTLKLLALAQHRQTPLGVEESWSISWSKDGKLLSDFANKTVVEIDTEDPRGMYTVNVEFNTAEIRVDKEGLTTDSLEHEVVNTCARAA